MLSAYPKAFALGERHIQTIFDDEVEITEKIDGSQFSFGKVGNELLCRSKGKMIVMDSPEKMFNEAVEYVKSISKDIPNELQFFCEYLKSPKHNTLAYAKIPKNHLALFGITLKGEPFKDYTTLMQWADTLDIDVVPLLFKGMVDDYLKLIEMFDIDSYLGGQKIEGIFVKNYSKEVELGSNWYTPMCGKFVSEKFKEKHQAGWKKENTGKGRWETFCEGHRTEARWFKAVHYLRDSGELTESPKDIGGLIKRIQTDIIEEEEENVKDFLWNQFKNDLLRKAIAGFPEFYKELLLTKSIEVKEEIK